MDNMGILWRFPPSHVDLPSNEIHLWCRSLINLDPEALEGFKNILSEDEHIRASKFIAEKDRAKFIQARGILRSVLAFYLKIDPKEVEFEYTRHRKPVLSFNSEENIQFNLSHAEDIVLIGIVRDFEIGVDVESLSHCRESEIDIIKEFCSPQEISLLQKVSQPQKLEAFLNCWTRKEAYLKALGRGLDDSLQDIHVTFQPGEPPRFLSIGENTQEASHWFLQGLQPATGYIGAVACRQRGLRLATWHWPDNGLNFFHLKNSSSMASSFS
jgi:4'-phosphopantetheinyl transferase